MEIEVERKGVGDPLKHDLERYFKRWIATLEDRGEHSPSTLSAYREHGARATKLIGHIALEKLSTADLDGLYGALLRRGGVAKKVNPDGSRDPQPLSARSVNHVHKVMHNCLEQARKWKMISENPARDAKAPTPQKTPPKAFTEAEVARLLDAAGNRENYIVLSVLLVTGIRRSELLGLALDAVDLDAGTIEIKRVVLDVDNAPLERDVTKSDNSARTISIPPPLVDLLREQKARVLEAAMKWGRGYRNEPRYLFCRPDGDPLCPMTMTIRLRRVMRRAKITGRPPTHGWRHSCATLMIGSNVDIKTVQSRMGHASAAFTLATYVHPIAERDQAAGTQLATLLKRKTEP